MNNPNQVKENVLAEIASLLGAFSDLEYQRRVWLRGAGPEVDCFADATIGFLSGCDIDQVIDVDWKEWGLPAEPLESLLAFRLAIGRFVDTHGSDPEIESVLADPEWRTVAEMAERVLSQFRRHRISVHS